MNQLENCKKQPKHFFVLVILKTAYRRGQIRPNKIMRLKKR
jgi:hypothetical protein